jgi:hypothetical protein
MAISPYTKTLWPNTLKYEWIKNVFFLIAIQLENINKPSSQVTSAASYESGGIYSPPNLNSSYPGKSSIYGGNSPSQDSNIYAVKTNPSSRCATRKLLDYSAYVFMCPYSVEAQGRFVALNTNI